jgi:hypothetical protein
MVHVERPGSNPRPFFWLVIGLAIAGCGSNGAGPDGGGTDLANRPDIAVPLQPTGCLGYVQCLLDCQNDTTCRHMCDVNSTPAARTLYRAAISCGQHWCLGTNDMGSGECVVNGGSLVNTDGSGATTGTPCGDCLYNVFGLLFGDPCMPASSPDCNPSLCSGAAAACLASTP